MWHILIENDGPDELKVEANCDDDDLEYKLDHVLFEIRRIQNELHPREDGAVL